MRKFNNKSKPRTVVAKVNAVANKEIKLENKVNNIQRKMKGIRINNNRTRKPYKANKVSKSSYHQALLYPELSQPTRVPGILSEPTVLFKRTVVVPLKTNGNGQLGFIFLPQALYDNTLTSNGNSVFQVSGMNNGSVTSTYTNSSTSTYCTLPFTYSITPDTVTSFRLVACSLKIVPTSNLLNNSGSIGISVVPAVLTTYTALQTTNPWPLGGSGANLTNIVAVNSACYHSIASINASEQARAIWLPNALCDFENIPMNGTTYSNNASETTTVIAGYITGTTVANVAGSTTFNAEINLIYELVPFAGGSFMDMERACGDTQPPTPIVKQIRENKGNVTQVIRS